MAKPAATISQDGSGPPTGVRVSFAVLEAEFGPRLQHLTIERAHENTILDADGEAGWPFRSLDTIDNLWRQKKLTEEQAGAARWFRDRFDKAHLDPLRAPGLERVPLPAGYREPDFSETAYACRYWIWRRIKALGGIATAGGSLVWHVVGIGQTLKEWCETQALQQTRYYDARMAVTALVTALDVIYAMGESGR